MQLFLAPLTFAVSTDLVLCLDSSGSISAADFDLQLRGTARALRDRSIVPQDGSVRITVLQFGSSVATEVAPTIIDSAQRAEQVARRVEAIRKLDGTTQMAECIRRAVDEVFSASPRAVRQVLDVSTDGAPDSKSETTAAAELAELAGIDVLNALGVGEADVPFLESLAFPQPVGGSEGFVVEVDDFDAYAAGIARKLEKEVSTAELPVLFVHGYCSSGETWRDLIRILGDPSVSSAPERYAGEAIDLYYDGQKVRRLDGGTNIPSGRVYTLTLRNNLPDAPDPWNKVAVANRSIRHHAYQLRQVIAAVLAATGSEQLDVVAHSMGGLVVRTYVQSFALSPNGKLSGYDGSSVRKIVTIDTPHGGSAPHTWLALESGDGCFTADTLNKREMSPARSTFLRQLNSSAFPQRVSLLSIASRWNAIGVDLDVPGDGVVPFWSQDLTNLSRYVYCGDTTSNVGNISASPLTFTKFTRLPDPGFLHLQVLGHWLGERKAERVAREVDLFLRETGQRPSCRSLLAGALESFTVPEFMEPGSTTVILDFGDLEVGDFGSPATARPAAATGACEVDLSLVDEDGALLGERSVPAVGLQSVDLGLVPDGKHEVRLRAGCTVDAGLQIRKDLLGGDGSGRCREDERTLCLQGGRFSVQAAWKTTQGTSGIGRSEALSGDTGYFWFFRPDNVEVVVKVLDGRALNGGFWVFYGALSNTEYWLRVTDTTTGLSRIYHNPPGRFASRGDTGAFGAEASGVPPSPGPLSAVAPPIERVSDDGEMDFALTYFADAFPPGFEGYLVSRVDFTGVEGVLEQVSTCWTRDSAFSGGPLAFRAAVFEAGGEDSAPGRLLAVRPTTASGVPVSSDGGRQGSNCRFYPVDVTSLGIPLGRPLHVGAGFDPTDYRLPSGWAGYLVGVDADGSRREGWFLDVDGWKALHRLGSVTGLGYRGLMIRARGRSTPKGSCTPSPTTLCLSNGRFEVVVRWEDFASNTGSGRAVALTADTGYFWFFNRANVELVVKVLDGRPVNGHFWVFFGALSNVAYTLTVTDTIGGHSRTYANPKGRFGSQGDTTALPGN